MVEQEQIKVEQDRYVNTATLELLRQFCNLVTSLVSFVQARVYHPAPRPKSGVRSMNRSRSRFAIGLVVVVLLSTPSYAESIKVCSFNIQFLGQSTRRRDAALATVVKNYDIVVVQELVAPPFPGTFPDGTPFKPDPEAGAFFGAMKSLGFSYWLSEEDTGTGPENHKNSTATEWFVTFYKENSVQPAKDLPHGFLDKDRTDHRDFERVPYAFSFRTTQGKMDFVLISVHLQPDASGESRRRQELAAIARWIDQNDEGGEQDFIVLGDMNIEDSEELTRVLPGGFVSLNNESRVTNTNQRAGAGRPYDHVVFRAGTASEIDEEF